MTEAKEEQKAHEQPLKHPIDRISLQDFLQVNPAAELYIRQNDGERWRLALNSNGETCYRRGNSLIILDKDNEGDFSLEEGSFKLVEDFRTGVRETRNRDEAAVSANVGARQQYSGKEILAALLRFASGDRPGSFLGTRKPEVLKGEESGLINIARMITSCADARGLRISFQAKVKNWPQGTERWMLKFTWLHDTPESATAMKNKLVSMNLWASSNRTEVSFVTGFDVNEIKDAEKDDFFSQFYYG